MMDFLLSKWADAIISSISFNFWIFLYTWIEENYSVRRSLVITYSKSNLFHLGFYLMGVYLLFQVVSPPLFSHCENQFILQLHNNHGIPNTIWDSLYVLIEVVSGLVLYDFIFFILHLCYHKTALWIIHKRHHTHKHVRATSVLNHSFFDAISQVGVNIIVQRYNYFTLFVPYLGMVVPKTKVARTIHIILVTWMLTESHSTVRGIFKHFPYIFTGICYHREHHTRNMVRYQQFFGHLDWLQQTLVNKNWGY